MRSPILRVIDEVQRAGEGRMVNVADAPRCEWALVLGAQILSNNRSVPSLLRQLCWAQHETGGDFSTGLRPTAVLDDRLATAAALFHAKRAARLVVSGTPAEVAVMSASLCERDVPGTAQVLDPRGLHTFESVRNAKALGARALLIVTQRFHLPRALYFAQKLGLDALGVIADRQPYAGLDRMARRERLSSVRAWWVTRAV